MALTWTIVVLVVVLPATLTHGGAESVAEIFGGAVPGRIFDGVCSVAGWRANSTLSVRWEALACRRREFDVNLSPCDAATAAERPGPCDRGVGCCVVWIDRMYNDYCAVGGTERCEAVPVATAALDLDLLTDRSAPAMAFAPSCTAIVQNRQATGEALITAAAAAVAPCVGSWRPGAQFPCCVSEADGGVAVERSRCPRPDYARAYSFVVIVSALAAAWTAAGVVEIAARIRRNK